MFHRFKDEDGQEYGSFEVFYISKENLLCANGTAAEFGHTEVGWYWWACFPGCLPDGDAHGPFVTEAEATLDALKET